MGTDVCPATIFFNNNARETLLREAPAAFALSVLQGVLRDHSLSTTAVKTSDKKRNEG